MGTELSGEVKWMIGASVAAIIAAIIAIGIASVAVSVTVLQFSRIAADMRSHEHRTKASNSGVIHEFQRLVDGMRDDYRDRMHGVEEVLRELTAVRQRLESSDKPDAPSRRDLERALSNVEHALTDLMLFRSVKTSDIVQRLEEIRDALQALGKDVDGTDSPSPPDPAPTTSPDPAPTPSEDDGTEESEATP